MMTSTCGLTGAASSWSAFTSAPRICSGSAMLAHSMVKTIFFCYQIKVRGVSKYGSTLLETSERNSSSVTNPSSFRQRTIF
jgi:hypothetical protein